jgi:hypothetical protein
MAVMGNPVLILGRSIAAGDPGGQKKTFLNCTMKSKYLYSNGANAENPPQRSLHCGGHFNGPHLQKIIGNARALMSIEMVV